MLLRTGLDPAAGRPDTPGASGTGREEAGCRWVAVRHDAVSIYVVVLLARDDGSAANPRFDYRRVRETCLAAEERYELQITAPIDGTATPVVTRAETEKAARRAAAGPAPRATASAAAETNARTARTSPPCRRPHRGQLLRREHHPQLVRPAPGHAGPAPPVRHRPNRVLLGRGSASG